MIMFWIESLDKGGLPRLMGTLRAQQAAYMLGLLVYKVLQEVLCPVSAHYDVF